MDQAQRLTVSLGDSLTRLRQQHAKLGTLIAEQESRQFDTRISCTVRSAVEGSIRTLESCLYHVQHGRDIRAASAVRRGHPPGALKP